ncbi:MAG: hypothetical protein KDE46_11610, partial [Caldilineaceae bacterium]|nr:hypothetical protein [Caldilineaceae bacterium]
MRNSQRQKLTALILALILCAACGLIAVASADKLAPRQETSVQKGLLREYWLNIPGTAVSNLTSNSNYPQNPSGSGTIPNFQSPSNVADNYGVRIRGYV